MSKKTPQAIRGTQDIFGADAEAFAFVVETFERVRRLYRFRRVEMPVFEKTEVFARSLGETTDVVSKEMYSFDDRGGESLTLRPEFTAGIARAFLTNGWQQYAPLKVATHGPLFRYERPQKGRYRQFHQIDAEVIGDGDPKADVGLLEMADQLLKELGINDVTLHLNTLGDAESRGAWQNELFRYFDRHRDSLSDDSRRRLATNPLRILDSKDEVDREIVADAPIIDQFLTSEAGAFFDAVLSGLSAAGITPHRNTRLVRGLDYYRHTAFEFIPEEGSASAAALGSQSTVLGGGRYDGLMEGLGGKPSPAVGWAAGIERLGMLTKVANDLTAREVGHVAIVSGGETVAEVALQLQSVLRRNCQQSLGQPISSVEAFVAKNRNKNFEKAHKSFNALLLIEEPVGKEIALVRFVNGKYAPIIPYTLSSIIMALRAGGFDLISSENHAAYDLNDPSLFPTGYSYLVPKA